MTLFTCDCYLDDIVPGIHFIKSSYKDKLEEKVNIWNKKAKLKEELSDDDYKISDFFNKDPDLMLLRNALCQEFYERYEDGFKKYIHGS